ncbi:MAG: LysR family transcriptional regulator [Oleispira sp.]
MNSINNVDLNLLKSLQVLLTERHVGNAARLMNISQSAMSHTLARLRTTFDDPLFVRTSKGLEPTPRALEISERLSCVLIEINHLFDSKEFNPSNIRTKFRIQTHDFISSAHLPTLFAEIRDKAPGIIFDIQMITESSYAQLDNGETDLIISAGLQAKNRFIQRGLCEEELVCLLDKNHPALKHWGIDALYQYPHIKLSILDERDDPISRYAKKHSLGPRIIGMTTQSLQLQPHIISATELIAFVPKSVADIGVKLFDLTIKPIPFDVPNLPIKAVWHERSQHNPTHQWIRTTLAESLG